MACAGKKRRRLGEDLLAGKKKRKLRDVVALSGRGVFSSSRGLALRGHSGRCFGCDVTAAEGKQLLLATAGEDGTARVWRGLGEDFSSVDVLKGHSEEVLRVSWDRSSGGRMLASGSADGTARLWRRNALGTFSQEATFDHGEGERGEAAQVYVCRFRAGGGSRSTLVTAAEDRVCFWDASRGQALDSVQFAVESKGVSALGGAARNSRGTSYVFDLAFLDESKEGAFVAALSDGTARVADAASQITLACLRGHTKHVTGCAASPDGLTVATASADGTVALWDSRTWKRTSLISDAGRGNVLDCAFWPSTFPACSSKAGPLLATWGTDGRLRLWDLGGKFAEDVGCVGLDSTTPFPVFGAASFSDGFALVGGSEKTTGGSTSLALNVISSDRSKV